MRRPLHHSPEAVSHLEQLETNLSVAPDRVVPGRQKAARYVAPRVRAIGDVQMRRLGERHVQIRRLGEWRAEVVGPPVVV